MKSYQTKKLLAAGLAFTMCLGTFGQGFAMAGSEAFVAATAPVTAAKQTSASGGVLIAQGIDQLMTEVAKTGEFSGSVILAQNGKTLLNKGYGYANEEFKVANTPKTVFRIASLSKQLTAAAVLKLEETGKLSTKDPLSKFIPDFPRGNEITVEMLLNHTSGLVDDISGTGMKMDTLMRLKHTPKELVDIIKAEKLGYNPGEKFFYSNHGYMLLGYIIETASGTRYDAYLKKNILDPLGIKDIQYDQNSLVVPNRAEGYKLSKGVKTKADFIDMSNPFAAGALLGTTEAYLKWQQSYYSPKILSQASWDKLFGTSVKTNRTPLLDEHYGYGVMTTTLPLGLQTGGKLIYHTGAVTGFRAFQLHSDSSKLDLVLLSNCESLDLEKLLLRIIAKLNPM